MKTTSPDDIESQLEEFRARFRELNEAIRQKASLLQWSTPNKVVTDQPFFKIRHFHLDDENDPGQYSSPPTLIVYSHVNSSHIVDLHKDHSLVRRLLEAKNNVYLLEWPSVDEQTAQRSLAWYLDEVMKNAVDWLLKDSGHKQINLLGICQGGTFSVCFSAMYPNRIARLATVITPIDFHAGESLLRHWSRHLDMSKLEKNPVNVSGKALALTFQALRPFTELQRQVEIIEKNDDVFDIELLTLMDQWVFNGPDQPGKSFAQFVRWFYQENLLVKGQLYLGPDESAPLLLESITAKVLNILASKDHIVPIESSAAFKGYLDPDQYHERKFPGGHIGVLVSKKAQQTILPELAKWLAGPID